MKSVQVIATLTFVFAAAAMGQGDVRTTNPAGNSTVKCCLPPPPPPPNPSASCCLPPPPPPPTNPSLR